MNLMILMIIITIVMVMMNVFLEKFYDSDDVDGDGNCDDYNYIDYNDHVMRMRLVLIMIKFSKLPQWWQHYDTYSGNNEYD